MKRNPDELAKMRKAGRVVAEILSMAANAWPELKPGLGAPLITEAREPL